MKKLLLGMALILLLSFIAACGSNDSSDANSESANGEDDPITFRIAGGSVGPDHSLTKTYNFLKEELEEKSDGRLQVELNVAGELGEDREIIEAMQMGQVHLAGPSPAALGGFDSSVVILDMPYLFTDRETAYEALDGEPGQMILDNLEEHGFKGLGYFENGFRNLTNNVKPVESIEDIQGLSLRTMENQTHIEAWKLLGANPTPMALGELYTALQQGTIDGQENPYGLIYANKFFEVQNYLTETKHVYAPNVMITNKDFYDELPSDLQEVISDAIDAATEYNRELAQEEEIEAKEALIDEGMEIYEFSDEQMQEMQELTEPVYEMFEDEIGADVVETFLNTRK